MYLRLVVAVAAVAGLTAFSPAPFPKAERKRSVDDAVRLQGTYKVIDYGRPNLARMAIRRSPMKVRIQGDQFSFMYQSGNDYVPSTTYAIKLHQSSMPRQLDMTYNSGDYTITMKGIYKIEGKKVTIAYVSTFVGRGGGFGGAPNAPERPTSFDDLPPNAMLLTMERE